MFYVHNHICKELYCIPMYFVLLDYPFKMHGSIHLLSNLTLTLKNHNSSKYHCTNLQIKQYKHFSYFTQPLRKKNKSIFYNTDALHNIFTKHYYYPLHTYQQKHRSTNYLHIIFNNYIVLSKSKLIMLTTNKCYSPRKSVQLSFINKIQFSR